MLLSVPCRPCRCCLRPTPSLACQERALRLGGRLSSSGPPSIHTDLIRGVLSMHSGAALTCITSSDAEDNTSTTHLHPSPPPNIMSRKCRSSSTLRPGSPPRTSHLRLPCAADDECLGVLAADRTEVATPKHICGRARRFRTHVLTAPSLASSTYHFPQRSPPTDNVERCVTSPLPDFGVDGARQRVRLRPGHLDAPEYTRGAALRRFSALSELRMVYRGLLWRGGCFACGWKIVRFGEERVDRCRKHAPARRRRAVSRSCRRLSPSTIPVDSGSSPRQHTPPSLATLRIPTTSPSRSWPSRRGVPSPDYNEVGVRISPRDCEERHDMRSGEGM
uniref:Uncharacterized protein n=1 Tax=Mycena chlorophos TaxID=658473 RepID=A0ABQ0KVN2_MYCCL|nr:predicted protein [Mycena chlorophos]